MYIPYHVSLELFRGAAPRPFARLRKTVLALSELDACHQAESRLNQSLPDVQYASATAAKPVWATPAQMQPLAAAA